MRADSNKFSSRLLIVDDDSSVRKLVSSTLSGAGYHCDDVGDSAAAWQRLQQSDVDLMTLDIRMPGATGLELLNRIRHGFPDVAILMLTGSGETSMAIQALTQGAYGYLLKPFARAELLIQVEKALEKRRLVIENRSYTRRLEETVGEQTRIIRAAHEETIYRLVRASLCRDEETGAHIQRTGWYSELLASTIGWSNELCDRIRLAAPMHDIGKLGIPDCILCKPGKLTSDEMRVMHTHTTLGASMLAGSSSAVLRMAEQIALGHHERWDGTGYPSRLVGAETPQAARIVAIVDVYDAISHDRVYRPAMTEPEISRIMWAGRGTHFDPELLDAFMSQLPEMHAIASAVLDDTACESGHESRFTWSSGDVGALAATKAT